jgi:hypothetical protein
MYYIQTGFTVLGVRYAASPLPPKNKKKQWGIIFVVKCALDRARCCRACQDPRVSPQGGKTVSLFC